MHTFEQSTGKWYGDNGTLLLEGYSGNGRGLNNPAMQNVAKVGPLPCGHYTIGELQTEHAELGADVMALIPDPDNEMFGRSDFYLHGDNEAMNHTASEGCIVASKPDRLTVARSTDKRLAVVPGPVD
jgi:hypothetical protein